MCAIGAQQRQAHTLLSLCCDLFMGLAGAVVGCQGVRQVGSMQHPCSPGLLVGQGQVATLSSAGTVDCCKETSVEYICISKSGRLSLWCCCTCCFETAVHALGCPVRDLIRVHSTGAAGHACALALPVKEGAWWSL